MFIFIAAAKIVTTTATATKRGRGSRTTNDRPPPGAVNLERSYEICRAVIQNSPNRHQLKAQLRPPPSMLAKSVQITNPATVQGATVTKYVKRMPDEQPTVKTNKVMIKVRMPSILFTIFEFHICHNEFNNLNKLKTVTK